MLVTCKIGKKISLKIVRRNIFLDDERKRQEKALGLKPFATFGQFKNEFEYLPA